MAYPHRLTRRSLIADLGRGTLAIAVFGPAVLACSGDDSTSASSTTGASDTTGSSAVSSSAPTSQVSAATTEAEGATSTAALRYERITLGSSAAYLLLRGDAAVLVDTGVAGSASAIGEALTAAGSGWENVAHVIVTHAHGDHVGSLAAVLAESNGATAYAGAGDIGSINGVSDIVAIGDGDEVFGLQIVETPGHTPGHISVLDPLGTVLVAGDALNGEGGGVVGPNARFTTDMGAAIASAKKLGTFDYDDVVFGHGDPVTGNASMLVRALAADL